MRILQHASIPHEESPTRSIRIATQEVTDPDVAVSSDGRWLVFAALGHLFQLPAAGGATKQLTSGPYYDAAPAISPDGTRVALISDRKVSSQGKAGWGCCPTPVRSRGRLCHGEAGRREEGPEGNPLGRPYAAPAGPWPRNTESFVTDGPGLT